jgi:hypothetical protein
VTYNSPSYLQTRHHIPEELLQALAAVESLAKKASGAEEVI